LIVLLNKTKCKTKSVIDEQASNESFIAKVKNDQSYFIRVWWMTHCLSQHHFSHACVPVYLFSKELWNYFQNTKIDQINIFYRWYLPRTSITTAVNDRIRRRKRSFTVVYNVKYDRIRSYFVVLPDTRFTIVYRRVVYDEIRSYTIVCGRILSFTPSYSVVLIKKLQIEAKTLLM
jgi:hypothetical protein